MSWKYVLEGLLGSLWSSRMLDSLLAIVSVYCRLIYTERYVSLVEYQSLLSRYRMRKLIASNILLKLAFISKVPVAGISNISNLFARCSIGGRELCKSRLDRLPPLSMQQHAGHRLTTAVALEFEDNRLVNAEEMPVPWSQSRRQYV